MQCGFEAAPQNGTAECTDEIHDAIENCTEKNPLNSRCVVETATQSQKCGKPTQLKDGFIWNDLCGSFWNESINLQNALIDLNCAGKAIDYSAQGGCSWLEALTCTPTIMAGTLTCGFDIGCLTNLIGAGASCIGCIA